MPSQLLVNLMLAVTTAEFFHSTSEMVSARFKASQLAAWIEGRTAPALPVNVDTRAKAYAVLVTVAAVLFAASLAMYTALSLSTRTGVIVAIVVVAATYVVTGVGFDRFHVIVGTVGRRIRSGQ